MKTVSTRILFAVGGLVFALGATFWGVVISGGGHFNLPVMLFISPFGFGLLFWPLWAFLSIRFDKGVSNVLFVLTMLAHFAGLVLYIFNEADSDGYWFRIGMHDRTFVAFPASALALYLAAQLFYGSDLYAITSGLALAAPPNKLLERSGEVECRRSINSDVGRLGTHLMAQVARNHRSSFWQPTRTVTASGKSLDRSGGSEFLILNGPAKVTSDTARRAGGDIRSPQRELWDHAGIETPAHEASDIIRSRRSISAQLISPRWGFDSTGATLPTARAVGYGYVVGFANWLTGASIP